MRQPPNLPADDPKAPLQVSRDYAVRHANVAWAIVHLANVLQIAFEVGDWETLAAPAPSTELWADPSTEVS